MDGDSDSWHRPSRGQVSRLIRIGGVEDHVHLLIDLHSMMALAPLVGEIKRRSSLWMKERRDRYPLFDGWSREYYAATLAEKDSVTVIEYINTSRSTITERKITKKN